ncbi:MAG: hypothetical protein HRF49_05735 [bacterium]|jgi:hypothetical protein
MERRVQAADFHSVSVSIHDTNVIDFTGTIPHRLAAKVNAARGDHISPARAFSRRAIRRGFCRLFPFS